MQFTNIRGFRTNFNSLQAGVETDHPDMLAISESKLDVGVPSSLFNILGYIFHRIDSSPAHGICVYVKYSLPITRESTLGNPGKQFMVFRLSLFNSTTLYVFFSIGPLQHILVPFSIASMKQFPDIQPLTLCFLVTLFIIKSG